jgi:plastocyanin
MKAIALACLLSLFLLAGCGSSAGPATPEKDAEGNYVIEMTSGNRFAPADAAVPVGSTVVWKHMGGAPHDVQAEDMSFSSGPIGGLQEGDSFSHTFEQAGTWEYFCHVHEGSGMKATITVE